MEDELYVDYYVLLRGFADEVNVCSGHSSVCGETQLKMVILMGVRNEELVLHIISLVVSCSIQEVKICWFYEATKSASATTIRVARTLDMELRSDRASSFYCQAPDSGQNNCRCVSFFSPPTPRNNLYLHLCTRHA